MKDTKIIALVQQKGGSGKTTLAAHLAVALYQKNYRVATVDIDPQEALVCWHLLRNQKEDFPCVSTTIWRLQNELLKLKESSDIIIMDTPPHNPMDTQAAVKFSDLAIIPVQPSLLDIWATHRTIDIIAKERIPHRIIWNRLLGDSSLLVPYMGAFQNVMNTQLPNHINMASAMAKGKVILEEDQASIASQAIDSFSDEIITLLFPETEDHAPHEMAHAPEEALVS